MERGSRLQPGSGRGSKSGSSSDPSQPSDPSDWHKSHANAKDLAHKAQVTELRRRIELLEDEDGYGEFSTADWIGCILGAVVIPVLILLWVGR